MLKVEQAPLTLLAHKICKHAYERMTPDEISQEYVDIKLSPVSVEGFNALVDDKHPLVALVKTGCRDPQHNDKLSPETRPEETTQLFVADSYIGGKSRDDLGEYICIKVDNMLPWYEYAISRYLLPPGWRMKNWIITTSNKQKIPYHNITNQDGQPVGMKVYSDGTVVGDVELDGIADHFAMWQARISGYVNHAFATRTSDIHVNYEAKEEVIDMMRNLVLPEDLIERAIQATFGRSPERDGKIERQALAAFLQSKLGVPINVFVPVYSWPKEK